MTRGICFYCYVGESCIKTGKMTGDICLLFLCWVIGESRTKIGEAAGAHASQLLTNPSLFCFLLLNLTYQQ